MIDLCAGDLRLTVDPDRGAAIRWFGIDTASGGQPVLAASCDDPRDAGQSALFPMAPFANRVCDNRLTIGGQPVRLTPNTDDPLCLHGYAWQRRWTVTEQGPQSCHLTLRLCEHGYHLALGYRMTLSEASVSLDLKAVNRGADTAPVGLGFHPYFPRRPDTRIRFAATTIWPEGPGHLPTGPMPVPATEDYAQGRALPPDWRNTCYSGWNGMAWIAQPGLGHDVTLRATGADVPMVYANPALPRLAVEPQSHVSGETDTVPNGLTALSPGEANRITLVLSVHPHAPAPDAKPVDAAPA